VPGLRKIEEFHDDRIEELQLEAAAKKGFTLVSHDLRLRGYCRSCAKDRARGAVPPARIGLPVLVRLRFPPIAPARGPHKHVGRS
jgi:hypothetical protein